MTSLSTLLPDEVSLETYNSLYLQRHSKCAAAVLAAACVSHSLGAPVDEVDATVFTTLADDAQLDILVSGSWFKHRRVCTEEPQTASKILDLLKAVKSSHVEEYRLACLSHFPLSTIFMTQSEMSERQKQSHVEAEKLEVAP